MATGIELIAAERQRQIENEQFGDEHDDAHDEAQLAMAGACYALEASAAFGDPEYVERFVDFVWPFEREWWKPCDDAKGNLIKAGALIAAEIDRLLRLETKVTQ